MAKLKFGALVTSGSGSLGGHTIQNSKGGPQLRTKPIARNMPSDSQRAIRSINPILQAGWKALTDSQRLVWNNFAKRPLCGHDLWMKYQFQYISRGAPFLQDPVEMGPPYYGSEQFTNPYFNGPSDWTFSTNLYYNINKATFNNLGTGQMYSNINLVAGNSYRMSFCLVDNVAEALIYVYSNIPYGVVMPPEHNGWRYYPSGLNEFDFVAQLSTIRIRILAGVKTPFSFTKFSIKQIY